MTQPPGYRIGLPLTPRSPQPGYRTALEFVPGEAPELPDPSAVQPGGSLPAPTLLPFAGVLQAAFAQPDLSATLAPGGVLPLAPPPFAGAAQAGYSSGVDRPLANDLLVPYQAAQHLAVPAVRSCFGHAYPMQPSGMLPLARPPFAGTVASFYAERHLAQPGGALPLATPGLAGQLTAPYNSNVQRPLARMAQRLHFEQATHASAALATVFEDARRAHAQVQAVVQQAQGIASSTQVREQVARITGQPVQSCAQQAQPLRQASAAGFETAQPLHPAPVQDWAQPALRLPVQANAQHWQIASPHRGQVRSLYQDAGVVRHMGLRNPPPLLAPIDWAGQPGWAIALELAPQFVTPRTWAELQSGPVASAAGLAQRLPTPAATVRYQNDMRPPPALAWQPWPPGSGPGPDPEPPGPGQTIIITAKRAYIVQNHIILTRLDTGTELQAHSFGMSLDYQSWTWSWQASLHHSAANHLGRDAQGRPAELLASVNGVPFRLRLERVARERRHLPQERFSVSGKGRAAILDAPWAPTMQFGNTDSEYTAEQLAAQVLTVNNVPIGWGVDWQLDDWLVPQGAWAHQGSYISAINEIAQAAGGYVQPHHTDKVLRILHKYPAAPWEWDSITPDFEIPAALAEVESTEFLDKPTYNRVYVGGVGQGVFGPMTRAGTAGELLAPQVTHPLITASAAWQQRARAELSDTGRQERLRISLPVLPETGVIVPGQFVRYRTSPQNTTTGIVRGTAIDWQRPRLRQTLEIEAHEPV